MKFYLAFVVAVIGVGMVAADENLKSKLQMALKSMLNENEELQMQSRDSMGRCESDTNSCNNQGTCTEDRWGSYYCKCDMPYLVGGSDSSCYDPSPEATKDLELEMLTRDSLGRCNADTNHCDGAGECVTKANARYAGEYICVCNDGYRNNVYGGCSQSKLQMALKSMLNENEELQMQSRDTKGRCESATNSCNNHGTCTKGRNWTYYCRCEMPYRVGGEDSSCYLRETREQVEVPTRKSYISFRQCDQDTNRCDGHGECLPVDSDGMIWFSCKCGEGYEGNNNGGCSPIVKRATEVDDDDFTERKKEIMRQLAEFLQEE